MEEKIEVNFGDIVYIQHIDSFFEILDIEGGKFVGTKIGEHSLGKYTLNIDDIDKIWVKRTSIHEQIESKAKR